MAVERWMAMPIHSHLFLGDNNHWINVILRIFCKDLLPLSIKLFPACVSDELLDYLVVTLFFRPETE